MSNALTNFFLFGSIMITAAVAPCQAKSMPPADGSLKISVLSGRPVADGIFLNGQGPFRFLIDTGAQTNQVDAAIAGKLRLKPTFRAEIATVTGSAMVSGGRLAQVTLGPASATDQEFLFTTLDSIHTLSSSIQGVLGQEFLARFDYLLDFAGRRIVFNAAEPEGGSRTALNMVGGRPAIESDRGTLVLDSGTEVAILFAAATGKSGAQVLTASGSSAAISAMSNFKFQSGGHSWSTSAASVPQTSAEEAGVVPASLFRAVYVSNSGKYVVLNAGH